MKRRLMAVLMLALLTFSLAACGSDKKDSKAKDEAVENPVAKEVVNLVMNELPAISADRNSAIGTFNDYFKEGSKANTEEWLPVLKEAKDKFENYIVKLNAVGVTTDEGRQLLDYYIKSADYQLSAMQDIITGIENYDSSLFDSASSKLKESKAAMGDYERYLKEVAEENGINLSGSFIYTDYSTATDAESE